MIDLKAILDDRALFETRFLSKYTEQKLGGLSPERLRVAVQQLQRFGPFPASSTPRFWTPVGKDEPVLTIGSLAANGAVRKPRFGLCVGPKGGLHLWTDKKTVEEHCPPTPANGQTGAGWRDWRQGSGREEFLVHSVPIIDDRGDVHLLAERQYPEVETFLRTIAARMKITDGARANLASQLAHLGQAPDAITPFVLDAFRHGDDEASDDADDGLPGADDTPVNAENDRSPLPAHDMGAGEGDLIVSHFEARDIFRCTVSDKETALGFMDAEFRPRYRRHEAAIGSGLYGIFFQPDPLHDPMLIYAGLFKNGTTGSPFGGDIFEMRWWKHLATMTLRDRRVGVAEATARYIAQQLSDRPLSAIAQSPAREKISTPGGCMAGLRRVLFADAFWETFAECEPAALLSYFSFTYVRLAGPADPASPPHSIRKRVAAAEKQAIRLLQPRCNKETPLYGGRHDVRRTEFVDVVTSALNGTAGAH